MNGNIWKEVLKQHEMLGIENIIPVSHIRIRPDIGILLDDNGNFVGATIIKNERCSIPCTIDSESRTNGISPHPIHDNMSYICGDYPNYEKRHEAYMKQLQSYTGSVDDNLAKSVYRYLERKTIRLDIKNLTRQIENIQEEKVMVVFATLSHRDTISKKWTEYYTSTLDKNGICGITGENDHIPDKYPKGIRNPSDQTKLFIGNPRKMDSMPTTVPGYIASQKIIHTLQFMIYEGNSWAYQILKDNIDIIPETWKEWIEEYQIKNGIQKKEDGKKNE
jgi:CRISPR-associated protein Csd1